MSDEKKVSVESAGTPDTRQYSEDIGWPMDYAQAIRELFPMPEFRPFQEDTLQAIDTLFKKGVKVVVVEAPTGSGKSPLAVTAGRKYPAYYCTTQKLLQDQYLRDFSSDIVLVKGRSSYHCPSADTTADVGPCVQFKRAAISPCSLNSEGHSRKGEPGFIPHVCPYVDALEIASRSRMTMFNYHAFHMQRKSTKKIDTGKVDSEGKPITEQLPRFPPRPLMILDEGHNIESLYMDIIQLVLSDDTAPGIQLFPARDPDELAQMCDPGEIDVETNEVIREPGGYVTQLLSLVATEHEAIKLVPNIGEGKDIRTKAWRKIQKYESTWRKMNDIWALFKKSGTISEKWVLQMDKKKDGTVERLVLKPVFVTDFVPALLFAYGARILILSATILDWVTFVDALGLKALREKQQVRYIHVPSTFPAKNRPVHVYPCGNLGQRTYQEALPRVMAGIRKVLASHPGQRGIIHCHSWKLLKAIQDHVVDKRLLFQSAEEDRDALLFRHERSKDGVLVAPAMHEGLDLKDDLARFQILLKVPYPNRGDPQIARRIELDPDWYNWQTALKLVQSLGRGVRSSTDWAVSYILDSGFAKFYQHTSNILPIWFKDKEVLLWHSTVETAEWLGEDVRTQPSQPFGSRRSRYGL